MGMELPLRVGLYSPWVLITGSSPPTHSQVHVVSMQTQFLGLHSPSHLSQHELELPPYPLPPFDPVPPLAFAPPYAPVAPPTPIVPPSPGAPATPDVPPRLI